MTEEQQQKVSELLNKKSRLSNDLATLYDKEAGFVLAFNYYNSFTYNTFTYNIGLNCNSNKEIVNEVKELLIRILKAELNKIEEELKQF